MKNKDNVRELPMTTQDMFRRLEQLSDKWLAAMKISRPSRQSAERNLFDMIVSSGLATGKTADESIEAAKLVIKSRRALKDL